LVKLAACPAILECHVATLNKAAFTQGFAKPGRYRLETFGRTASEQAY
jgi:hypothetical protein